MKISVTILAKNSAKHLHEVLSALREFEEVLLYDNGSTDQTVEIAKTFPNVNVVHGPFLGFGPTHNRASALARHDWIFSIDSDEVATKALVDEIQKLKLNPECVYSVPRHNEYNGKWIRWCGWYPDRVVRLYNRTKTNFSEALVHEGVEVNNLAEVALKNCLRHYSYDTISDFLTKMQSYSDLFAAQYAGKKRSSPAIALVHAFAAFFKSYFLKRGLLGGYEGFLISSYNGHTAFYKYLKLYEANQKQKK